MAEREHPHGCGVGDVSRFRERRRVAASCGLREPTDLDRIAATTSRRCSRAHRSVGRPYDVPLDRGVRQLPVVVEQRLVLAWLDIGVAVPFVEAASVDVLPVDVDLE